MIAASLPIVIAQPLPWQFCIARITLVATIGYERRGIPFLPKKGKGQHLFVTKSVYNHYS